MNLIGLQLQRAGIPFLSAKAMHHRGIRVDEIVCASREDADKADAWAEREGYPVKARVATPEELAEHERFAW